MKINAWADGPVECEAEIEFEDVLSLLATIVAAGSDCPNRCVAAMDYITRILAAVEDDWIARMKPEHRTEIHNRLWKQAERY